MPDEEKEKIGPKNVSTSSLTKTSSKISSAAVISAKPQANPNPIKPPVPTPVVTQAQPTPMAVPLAPPQAHMIAPQPPVMMMQPMGGMRPPPLMMAAPPPMAGFMTPMGQMPAPLQPVPMKHPADGALEEEPANKKVRNEDSLIPEDVFMSRNPVSETFLPHYQTHCTMSMIYLLNGN